MSGEMIVAKGCEGDLPTAPEPGMGQAVTLSNPVINVTQEPFTTDPHKAKPRRRGDGSKKKVPVSTTSSKKVKHDVAQAADQFRTPVSAGRSSLSGGESSGSGGSEKKKKVYIRLTPADDFSSQETSKAGYNPKLELFIKVRSFTCLLFPCDKSLTMSLLAVDWFAAQEDDRFHLHPPHGEVEPCPLSPQPSITPPWVMPAISRRCGHLLHVLTLHVQSQLQYRCLDPALLLAVSRGCTRACTL